MLTNWKPTTLLPIVCISLVLTGCAESRRLMSWQEYSRRSYTWPYLLNIYTIGGGSLLYFGARHSNDPNDQQFSEIEYHWAQFKPDIAFNEGGDPPVEKTRNEEIRKYGEPGLVRFLAARDNIPVRSLDPTRSEEVAILRKKYPLEQIKMFYLLRQMTEYQRIVGGDESREEYLLKTIEVLNTVPGLDVRPKSISEIESTFARNFPGQGNYKDASPSWFDPDPAGTVFNSISRTDTDFRDRYIVDLISRTIGEKKRVFAVIGATHVVREERAIREMTSHF